MLFGQTKAAIKWLSEQSKGRVLPSDSFIDVKHGDGSSRISVLDALRRKHPEPKCPPDSALLSCDTLLHHLDVEVTGAHIKYTASTVVLVPVALILIIGRMCCYGMGLIVFVFMTPLLPWCDGCVILSFHG